MFTLHKTKNYHQVLRFCYSQDKELIEKYHVTSGSSLTDCIAKTIEDFKNLHESFEFHIIKKDEEIFGYFGTEFINGVNFLTSFFILPQFRNKENSKEFFSMVRNHFNNESFITGIYAKNTRAESWLKKNGGVLVAQGLEGKAFSFLGDK